MGERAGECARGNALPTRNRTSTDACTGVEAEVEEVLVAIMVVEVESTSAQQAPSDVE